MLGGLNIFTPYQNCSSIDLQLSAQLWISTSGVKVVELGEP